MKLSGVRENYYFHSGKVSDIIRQMALAGVALIWVFKAEVQGQSRIPNDLMPAAVLIVLGITLDFLQYVSGTLMWAIWARKLEKESKQDDDSVALPDWINYPALVFFWTKIPTIVAAYVIFICFFWAKLR
ncbi:MAG TPA: hypothetical protein VIB39_20225 [Candidatus Angelobacter sp.]|jgi:hypothetical protein